VISRRVAADSDEVLDIAQEVLERGELIVYPTDTLYAVGGKAMDGRVAAAVRRAKGRPDDKPLPVIVANLEQLRQIASPLPRGLTTLCDRFWPGPLTLVLSAARAIPEALTSGTGRMAVRIPALALARQLCERAGPLIATSANCSGEPAATTCDEALRAMGQFVALAIDGGAAVETRPSTVVDLTGENPRLVRAGAVGWETVLSALGEPHPR
jgi:L-threonylcarbamoyladenylate synthase